MKKIIIFLLLIPAVLADVTIHQVLYDPINSESGGEFIQLYNDDIYPIDISGWVIQTSASAQDVVFPDGALIQGESYYLVTDKGWSDNKDDPSWPNATLEETITLKNSDSGVVLLVEGTVIDVVGWGNAPEGMYEGTPTEDVDAGQSLLRVQDTDNNADDFVGGEPTFSLEKNAAEIDIEVEVISADVSIEEIIISDADTSTEGIQILPHPGASKEVPIIASIISSMPVNVTGEFNNISFPFKRDNITYTSSFLLNYTLHPGNYILTLTATTSFTVIEQTINVEVLPLVAFSLDKNSLHLGNVTPGSTIHISGDEDMATESITLQNLGNTALDFGIYGTSLNAENGEIPISSLSFGFGDELIVLDENNQVIEIGLPSGGILPVDFMLIVPQGIDSGSYKGKITLVGIGE